MASFEKFFEASKAGAAWLRDYITAIKNGRFHPFTAVERKAREATRNEPWGPTGTQLAELTQLAETNENCQIIFAVLEHRLSYSPPKWRNVYKALVVIEYLVKRGGEDCLRLGTDPALVARVRELSAFQFTDPDDGRDYGINVRKKSETLAILLEDAPRLGQEREEYARQARRYAGYSRDDMLQGASFKATPSTGWGAARAGSDIADDECAPSSPTPTQRNAGEMKGVTLEENKKHLETLKQLLDLPDNRRCADCRGGNAGSKPTWASINCGVFICMKCAGYHRGLGVHISQVRSCTLDTWLPPQLEFMAATGNRVANAYWEARLGDTPKPANDDPYLESFIRQKYINRAFADAQGTWPPALHSRQPVEAEAPAAEVVTTATPVQEPPPLIDLLAFDDEPTPSQQPEHPPSQLDTLGLADLAAPTVAADPWQEPSTVGTLASLPSASLASASLASASLAPVPWLQEAPYPSSRPGTASHSPWEDIPTRRSVQGGLGWGPPPQSYAFEKPAVQHAPVVPAASSASTTHGLGNEDLYAVIPEGPPSGVLPPRSPTPQSLAAHSVAPSSDPWALQAAYGPPPTSSLRFSTDLGALPAHTQARAAVHAEPAPQQQAAASVQPAAPSSASGGDLLDRLQWHGLQSFMNDANRPQPLAPAMGRAPPPKNVSMREAKMQQHGSYAGW